MDENMASFTVYLMGAIDQLQAWMLPPATFRRSCDPHREKFVAASFPTGLSRYFQIKEKLWNACKMMQIL